MDFVTGLPKSQGYNSIYVVIDMLTKLVHLFLVRKEASAKDIAHVFMKGVFMYHGLPCRVIFDQDTKFASIFWRAIFKTTKTKLSFSTTYHAQTDDQTKQVNQVVEDMLQAYCMQEPKKWTCYLYLWSFHTMHLITKALVCHPFKHSMDRNA